MPQSFTYQVSPMRVVFGIGTVAALADELGRLGISSALVLASRRQQAELGDLAALTGGRVAGVFDGAVVHTPVAVTDQAMQVVRDLKPDGVVAIGAGAATGLSKAIALRTDLPQLILPTSYAGSEMTPVLGETVERQDHTIVAKDLARGRGLRRQPDGLDAGQILRDIRPQRGRACGRGAVCA